MTKNLVFQNKTRYIDIQYHFFSRFGSGRCTRDYVLRYIRTSFKYFHVIYENSEMSLEYNQLIITGEKYWVNDSFGFSLV
jgi:hypothetical protein